MLLHQPNPILPDSGNLFLPRTTMTGIRQLYEDQAAIKTELSRQILKGPLRTVLPGNLTI